jgi:hypothetical protein
VQLLLAVLVLAALPARELGAQGAGGPPGGGRGGAAARPVDDTIAISLLTMGQGDAVWEKFGHNAIRVRDAAAGTDVAYNWGMFDFEQPNFLGRFLTGDTRYWMEGFDAPAMIEYYARQNRTVWEQELNLSPAASAELRDFLLWNAREENKFYRYDYYRDNCSTRVRDAIDRAAGGALRRATADMPTASTYRSHTRRLTRGEPAVYTGIQLALGHPADAPISAWEESFLPTRLEKHVRRATVIGADGEREPLVRRERELFHAAREPEAGGPPDFTLPYLGIGLAIAAMISAAARSAARARGGGLALAALGGTWALAAGVLGTALLLAGTVTRHVFMGRNENLLLVNPLLLVLAALIPVALLARGAAAARLAARLAAAVAVLSVLALLVKALPWFDQRNVELIGLFLPPNVALAWGLARVARARRPTTSPA